MAQQRGAKRTKPPSEFGQRVIDATKLAGFTSTTKAAEALGWSGGTMSRLVSGERGAGVDTTRQIADLCRVSFEWLALGRGPMRPPGIELTAQEQAAEIARRYQTTDASIRAVNERDVGLDRDEQGWFEAYMAEERQRERLALPEKMAGKQRTKIRAEKRKLGRAIVAATSEPPPAAPSAPGTRTKSA